MVPEKQNLCPDSRSAVFLLPGTSFRGRRPHEGRRRDGSGACAGSAHRIEFSYEDNKLSRVESEEAFVYDPYDGVHTCLDPDGSSLVLTYETPVAESYTWTWYDAQGNILRQEVTSD